MINTTERKFVSQDMSTEIKGNSLKTYLGVNLIYNDFHSSLKTKQIKLRK